MAEITDLGVLAYRNGRYVDAINLLLCATKDNPKHWIAWMYLGQAYDKRNMVPQAVRVFTHLVVECPDQYVQNKAEAHLLRLEALMVAQFGEQAPWQTAKSEPWALLRRTPC
ncbi:MAG TPA: tetratricopeptide repeat protein [Candidatus Obscuribacterales bacterium]